MRPLEGRSVLFVIAHRSFRDEELLVPRRIIEEAGARTQVASSALGPASGMLGAEVEPDLLYSAAKAKDWDAVVFVGGAGATEFFPDRTAHRLARDIIEEGRVLGAICYGSSTLAEAGVLEGRKATAFPTRKDHLIAKGAKFTGEPVTRDGRIVTANGPEAADAFGRALVEAIVG